MASKFPGTTDPYPGTTGTASELGADIGHGIDTVVDDAAYGADKAADTLVSEAHTMGDKAADLAARAGETASDIASKAGSSIKGAASSGKDMAADGLHNLADVTRDLAGKLDGKSKPVADYAAKAADGIDRFSDTLKSKSVDDIGNDARDFVRDHPAVVVGAVALIGFALARFMKAGPRDDRSY